MWVRHLENYFVATREKDGAVKRSLHLHFVGNKIYKLFRHLPNTGAYEDYHAAVRALNAHFDLQLNPDFERFKLRQARQIEDESIYQFYTRLRELASTCTKDDQQKEHGAEARSIPGWLASDPFSGVAGLLNRWAAPVLRKTLDEKVTPLLVEDAVESVKLRGAKLELKAAGQVGWLFLSALRTVYRKTLTQDAEIRKLRDEVTALQKSQLLMKETIESAVTRGDQMEARCTALAVRVAKQKSRQKPKMPSTVQVRALVRKEKSRQKPKIPSTVQVRALVRKENWDPYTWDGTVSDNDDWNWEDEVEVRVTELGGVESGEGRVGEIEGEKGVNGGQIQNSRLVRDYTQSELLQRTRMFRQMPAEPLFKWLVRLWDTGAKDALQNPFMLGPITEGDPFELDMIVQDDVDDVVMWSLWQRQGKRRVPQDWALVEIERITDDRPVTLKT
ncbi:hypothetical protein NDU88_001720 [Pleurodeles waltl]|uniref:Retrotransposon gag domain-containing protein n=1 Tax=Pleurodeles waltl TaxID=8319 RepID=A0AAV7U7M7_PLEWA|nr:hypothetical protein NDU88_001720 [Pleurodeles waltl]